MDYDNLFTSQLDALRAEGNYRIFADLERYCGAFPRARSHRHGAEQRRDGLVLQRLPRHGPASVRHRRDGRGDRALRRRRRRHPQHLGHQPLPCAAGARTRRPARQGKRAAVHLGLRLELGDALDARQPPAGGDHPVGRAQPRLDDRGHPPCPLREADLAPQRSRGSRPQARGLPPGRAEDRRLRERLLDGRRHRADRRDPRRRREARRDDLSRRGACRRPLRGARRRHLRAGRAWRIASR